MARWIFQFRSVSERSLTDAERLEVRDQACRMRVRWLATGMLTVAAFAAAILCSIMYGSGASSIFLGLTFGFSLGAFWLLAMTSNSLRQVTFHQRLLDIGLLERYERVPGDRTVRDNFATEAENSEAALKWLDRLEDGFEKALRESTGSVNILEAVGGEGILFSVEDVRLRRMQEVAVSEVG